MDAPISNSLRTTFLVHMIVALLLGVVLFLIPGRGLVLLGWTPAKVELPEFGVSTPGTTFVDPIITRLLGAALLALAYASFSGWRAHRREQVNILVQAEFIFCVLGLLAFVEGMLTLSRPVPVIMWVLAIILAAFAVAWGLALRKNTSLKSVGSTPA